jgi:two-component system, NarL family, response regulator DevR
MVSVALIDDNRLARRGLTSILSNLPDIQVVAAVSDADVSSLAAMKPDVVLLGLGPGNAHDLALVERVRMEVPDARIIAIGLLPDDEGLLDVVQAGVSGFALAEATPDDLLGAIRSVVSGHNVLPHQVTGALFAEIADDGAPAAGPKATEGVQLTPRQREVIELISEGMSNKKIAAELHISVHTVKSHIRHIMKKLDLNTRLQISAWAHDEESG